VARLRILLVGANADVAATSDDFRREADGLPDGQGQPSFLCDADHGDTEPVRAMLRLLRRRCECPRRQIQETDMDTENVETKLLSDDELDAVAGGAANSLVGAFVQGFLKTAPQAGYDSFAKVFAGCI
jgi:hypothetical protein